MKVGHECLSTGPINSFQLKKFSTSACSSAHSFRLYEQDSVVREWEQFLEAIVTSPRPAPLEHRVSAVDATDFPRKLNENFEWCKRHARDESVVLLVGDGGGAFTNDIRSDFESRKSSLASNLPPHNITNGGMFQKANAPMSDGVAGDETATGHDQARADRLRQLEDDAYVSRVG